MFLIQIKVLRGYTRNLDLLKRADTLKQQNKLSGEYVDVLQMYIETK